MPGDRFVQRAQLGVGPVFRPAQHDAGAELLGGLEASDVLWTVGWMGAIVALFVPLALRAYNRRA